MARLRLAGLKGALGASLTSGATSITFAAALTYNNGTAVPTLGANDYIPITIKDATGSLSEIVWLTAYTTAGTTGTIVRGREGTTGVSHASGDKWVHSASPADFSAISRIDDPNDPLWGSDLGFDSEFEADDTSGTLPSGWSWHNQGGAVYKQQWGAGIISVPGDTSGTHRVISRSVTGFPSTWTARAKCAFATDVLQFTSCGMVIRNAAGKAVTIQKVGGDSGVAVTQWNADGSFNANIINSVMNTFSGINYFAIRFNSSTSVDFLWSPDGVAWKTMLNIDPTSWLTTITEVGLWASNANNSQPFDAAFYWFRVR